MKRTPDLRAVVGWMLTLLLVAGSTTTGQGRSAFAGCLTSPDGTVHDFGVIGQTATVEHTFILKNTCDRTLEIESAKSSCGCTAAVVAAKSVKPGGETRLNVRYTPIKGSTGRQGKTVSVYLRGEQSPALELQVAADVRSELQLLSSNAGFPDTPAGKPVTVKTALKNTGDRIMTVESVINTMTVYGERRAEGGMEAKAVDRKRVRITPKDISIAPGKSVDVEITVTPDSPGRLHGAIEFTGRSSQVYFTMTGTVLPAANRKQKR